MVAGSVDPERTGIEAGLSATGDIFEAIARRAGTTVAELSRGLENYQGRRDRPAAAHLGQWRSHRAGESGAERRHARLATYAHGAGRTIRRHRRHGLPHARDSGAHGRARRAGGSRHQRRRHSAEESGAEPGIRERAGQADSGAQGRCHQPGLGDLCVPGGRHVSAASKRRRTRCARDYAVVRAASCRSMATYQRVVSAVPRSVFCLWQAALYRCGTGSDFAGAATASRRGCEEDQSAGSAAS